MTHPNFLDLIEKAVDSLVESDEKQEETVKKVRDCLRENGFPPSYNKDHLVSSLDQIINEEGPDAHQQLVDRLLWQKSVPRKLTKAQKTNLTRFRDMIANAQVRETCTHTNLALTGSLHGGGFSPILPYPEIICRDCGVNVTIYTSDTKTLLNDYGVKISEKNLAALKKWLGMGREYMGRKKFALGEDVVKYPQRVLAECDLWQGELPFTITNVEKFNARSGA